MFAVGATLVLLPLIRLTSDGGHGRGPAQGPSSTSHCPDRDCVILALDDGGHGSLGSARVATARGISLTGSGAAFIVLGVIVYRLTDGSAVWLSLALLTTMGVQGLVQPIASWLGDRFDRRRVLVAADLAAGARFLALSSLGRRPARDDACITAIWSPRRPGRRE